jgi:hypothetical protein
MASSSLDTEAAQAHKAGDGGYTIAATAHAVDTGSSAHMIGQSASIHPF